MADTKNRVLCCLLAVAACISGCAGINEASVNLYRTLVTSFDASTKHAQENTEKAFNIFEVIVLKNEPERARPIFEQMLLLKKHVAVVDSYITDTRWLLITSGGGLLAKDSTLKDPGNTEVVRGEMIRKGRAAELKKRIRAVRAELLAALSPNQVSELSLLLNADDGTSSWEHLNFADGLPLAGAVASLARIRADLANAGHDVIAKIFGDIETYRVYINDRVEVVAIPESNYVFVGDQYKAQVLLVVSDRRSTPEVTANGKKLEVVDGKGIYTAEATTPGVKKWSAILSVKQSDGTVKEYAMREQTYTVMKRP